MSDFKDLKRGKKTKSYISPTLNSSPTEIKEDPNEDLYQKLPAFLHVQTSEQSGRGIITRQTVRAGTILLSIRPDIAVLSNQYLETYCSTCTASDVSLKRCTRCRVVWYCTSECQNRDWALHKHECAALIKWAESAPSKDLSIPSDAVRGLARMIWKKQKVPESVWAKEIDAMQSHRQDLKESAYELHTHLAHSVIRYLGVASPEEMQKHGIGSASELVDMVSRFVTNTFTVSTPSLTPIGASISPMVALFNHSCEPNAVVVFPRAEMVMQVIAIKNIQADQEILTAYIDTTLPRTARQTALEETYSFKCACTLCSASELDPREAMRCSKQSCDGFCPFPTEDDSFTRCIKCKAVVHNTDATLDAIRVGQEGLDKATALQYRDPNKSLQLATNLIPILISTGSIPSSHPLLALNRLYQSMLIERLETQDELDEAIRVMTRTVTGLTAILTPGHPVRGIAMAELGKVMAVDEPSPRTTATYPPSGPPRLKLALETLVKAREELMIGFGSEGGQVGMQIRETIVGLEKELGVWTTGVRNVLS